MLIHLYFLIVFSSVREKLGMTIQAGNATEGHSSIEDASATLDLVRWYILNKQKSAVHSGVQS